MNLFDEAYEEKKEFVYKIKNKKRFNDILTSVGCIHMKFRFEEIKLYVVIVL